MTSDRIDHAAEAARVVQDVGVGAESSYGNAMAYAQVHATLALVEQQRIHNLIALSVPQDVPGGGDARISSYGHGGVLLTEIRDALGIRE